MKERVSFESMYNMNGSLNLNKAVNDMTGGEIVIEAMIKILPDQSSNFQPAPSESGLASEVVR